jgi:transcription elongation factor GreA-like protein
MIYARNEDFPKAINMIKECLKIDSKYPNAKTFLEDFENIVKILRG